MRRFLTIVLWLMPTFGLTRHAYRKNRDASENDGLRKFLLGLTPSESGCRFWIQGGPPKLILSGGSYELLYRFKNPDGAPVHVLNMDHPLADLPVPEWRKRVLEAAAAVRVEVLPLSERALISAMRGAGQLHPRLIVREGYEAVFTLGDQYYLSGYDRQEDPPLYFLCQLPGPASSVSEARDLLQPPSVKEAIANGVRVERQGDLFFIATSMSDEDVKGYAPFWWGFTKPLYGTAHTATCVAQLPGGVMIASGIVRHKPDIIGETRNADHSDLYLGHDWHLVARNTVPAKPTRPEPKAQEAAPFSDPFWALS